MKKKINEIKSFLKEKYPNYTLSSTIYVSNEEHLDIICDKSQAFKKSWCCVSKDRTGLLCDVCDDIQTKENNKMLNTVNEIYNQHKIMLLDNYKNCRTIMNWKCVICSINFTMSLNLKSLDNFISYSTLMSWTCLDCDTIIVKSYSILKSKFETCVTCKKNSETASMLSDFCNKHNLKLLDSYIDAKTTMNWVCLECGLHINKSWKYLSRRGRTKCVNCNKT